MIKQMRQDTLQTLGLGTVLEIFKNGKMPALASEYVDKVFGKEGERGALVISGANGIVGAGKMMQFGVRLKEFGVPIIGLDFPGAADGLAEQYSGLAASFGRNESNEIMSSIIRMNYDGKTLPKALKKYNPKFLLEAIPEILDIKKAHYEVFRKEFPGIEIRSVTSGFPESELGVGIAHPAFPHQINKVWETVEETPSDITKMLWALGMIPMPVSDHWSFVLDVLFCGVTLAASRFHEATNMPYWKIDKYVRKYFGPNPFRAHDVIGAKGANFLTWSCLAHLEKNYGEVYAPSDVLTEKKDSGQNWYPLNHLRPIVNWEMKNGDEKLFETWILGPLIQMTSLILHENRSHFTHINMLGEICAQFRSGLLAQIRNLGSEKCLSIVGDYHKLHPQASESAWYPETLSILDNNDWNQLYVNAEHDGERGVITIARESYNWDVNNELNRAIDWLKSENINNVILTSDFHLATQLVGAQTSDFYPALNNIEEGKRISGEWSKTARRLHNEFENSVGFMRGKRCLGGMLELFLHCHYLVATSDLQVGAPEVNLPVVPGMEMCHWTFRKADSKDWSKIANMMMSGKFIKASNTVGWLVDYAGGEEDAIKTAWSMASSGSHPKRELKTDAMTISKDIVTISATDNQLIEQARKAIFDTIVDSCAAHISESLEIQSKHSAEFMTSKLCKRGIIGQDYSKTMNV
jgi:enoyl-CoA hydratase/carnithine racemase